MRFIDIAGIVEMPEEISMDDFIDLFLDWCDQREFKFGGGFKEVNSEGEDVETVRKIKDSNIR